MSAIDAAGKVECTKLLQKLIGATVEMPSFRQNIIAPQTPAAVQLDQSTLVDSSKLTMKEVATLAYMWQMQFFSVDSKPAVCTLISNSLDTTDSNSDQVLETVAEKGSRWKPGRALTTKLRKVLGLHQKGE